jgi:hypothetical protein
MGKLLSLPITRIIRGPLIPPSPSEPVFVNLSRGPGIDSLAWRADTPTLFVVPARQATQVDGIDSLAP